MGADDMAGIPLWLKLLFSLWVLIWAPLYLWQLGPQNYFWLCNLANFLILAGLWRESPLLLSTQLLAVLLVGSVWTLDVGIAFITGNPPVTGTDYMFDSDLPLWLRLLSLYHVFLPPVCVYGVYRLGYAPRALPLQTAITVLLILASYLFTDPERHINWAHPPFEALQGLPAQVYLPLLIILLPALVYLPVHGTILLWRRRFQG
ncbi:MAG: hypothetical protein EA349_13145 [Halomonadaceae bacterium]|nr:MAG: hypothetical protein EA349_13145 [Halomonadaceae bacterium]